MHRSICQARVCVYLRIALEVRSIRSRVVSHHHVVVVDSTRFDSIRAFAHDRGSRQQL